MAKNPHEALHRVFQEDATLFARAFARVLGVEFPPIRAVSVINTDLTEVQPLERWVDTPLLVETADGGQHVLIIEAQSQEEKSKLRSWPYYIAHLSNKFDCSATLVVVTADRATAAWARRPIRNGFPRAGPRRSLIRWCWRRITFR